MIHIIISIDPTTEFLFTVIDQLKNKSFDLKIIKIHPNNESYIESKKLIINIPKNSTILFLGHGQSNQLFGGESEYFEKKPIVSINEMKIFDSQCLILLACNSAELLKKSFQKSSNLRSIGFGDLPTEIHEINMNRKYSKGEITPEIIMKYKSVITDTIFKSLEYYISQTKDLIEFKDYLCLLINKSINKSIFKDNDRILADLLFKMRNEIMLF